MSSYIDQPGTYSHGRYYGARAWSDFTRARLIWLYGEAGLAKAAGTDLATAADLAAWRALGRRAVA